ncbi:MAG TPA: hypothetical protein VKU19_15950 [Bryobacteraceae bacterium]|nr:hypothetical protein [Bryobacteraceae bacterium]
MKPGVWSLLTFCLSTPAFSQVDVHLSLLDGKTSYRSGEPIRLVLTFSALSGSYMLNMTGEKPMSNLEEVVITPETGVYDWLKDYRVGHPDRRDYANFTNLSGTSPQIVELALNDYYRLDGPGTYNLRVTTKRIFRGTDLVGMTPVPPVTSNEVSFTVTPMTDDEERAEVDRLTAALVTVRRGPRTNDRAASQQAANEASKLEDDLMYLAGEPSTREKVRRMYQNPPFNLQYGLFIARKRALVVQTLEAALRDPSVWPGPLLLDTADSLRRLLSPGQPAGDTLETYESALIESLPKRTGTARTMTESTILQNLPKDPVRRNAILAALRPTLLADFEHLAPGPLLGPWWDVVRDASLEPALAAMIRRFAGRAVESRYLAIKRLIDLAPDKARPYVVEEIADPKSRIDYDVVSALKEPVLAEADEPLLAIFQERGSQADDREQILQRKSALAARFASPAIYHGMLEIYQKWGAKWPSEVRGGVLGYLVRVHEAETLPMIEQESASLPNEDYQFWNAVTRVANPPAVDALLKKRLESDDPKVVGWASYVMMNNGLAGDQAALQARLERWRNQWRGRITEADDYQKMLETNLGIALVRSRKWHLSDGEVESLRRDCLTAQCQRELVR